MARGARVFGIATLTSWPTSAVRRAPHACTVGALAAVAWIAGAAACATSSGLSESGEAISCGPSMYISDGGCVDFPGFSDAIVPAGDDTGDGEGGGDAEASARTDGGPSAAPATRATCYLANPAHTNAIDDSTLVPPLARRWSRSYVGYTTPYPLVAGGAVYLLLKAESSGAAHQLVAIDQQSGAELWGPVSLDGVYVEGHAYDGGRVFTVSSSPDEVEAFDATTGSRIWTAKLPSMQWTGGAGPPTAYGGVLYIGGPGIVVALDETKGTVLWSTPTDLQLGSSPAVTDDGVFMAGGCGEAYALDRMTGSLLWHYAPGCDGGFDGTAMVFDRRVYIVPNPGSAAVVLDALTGHVLTSPPLTIYPSFDQGQAFYTSSQALQGWSLANGRATWSFAGDMGLFSIPFVAGGTVYVPSSTGQLFGVDETSGVQSWSTWADSLGGAAPIVGAEGVLVAVLYGSLGIVAYGHVDLPDASVVLGDGAPPTPTVLASGGGAGSLALDPTNVYWTDGVNGEVRKVSKDGGTPAVVHSAPGSEPWSVAVDATRAYWTSPNIASGGTNSAVMSIPLAGGSATTLAAVSEPMVLAASASNLYWTTSGAASIESVPLDGGTVTTLVSDPTGATAIAIDARNLYWCASDGVHQEPLAGGTALSIGPAANAIAVDATDVYYVTGDGSVGRVPIGGGNPTVLATGRLGTLVAVAVDAQNVYWIEGEGTIMQGAVAALPKSGGRVAVLASGLSDPSAIAVDDSGIYFTNPAAGGLVEKIAK